MSQLQTILSNLSRGRVENDIDTKIMEVIKGVRETGGKGEIDIKLKFTLSQHGEMLVSAIPKAKVPPAVIPPSIFFIDADNDLLMREDPKQPELEEVKRTAPKG